MSDAISSSPLVSVFRLVSDLNFIPLYRWAKKMAILFSTVALVACGGGGGGDDSSTGAGGSSSSATVNLAQFAGTYTGTITATVTVDNGVETLTRDVTFVISVDGSTITVEGQSFPLTSAGYAVSVAIPLAEDDIVCTLEANFEGSITVDLISGAVSGAGNCVRGGMTFPAQLSGYSGATRVSS